MRGTFRFTVSSASVVAVFGVGTVPASGQTLSDSPRPSSEAAAGVCPGDGDCCVAHGLPGCNDFECCDFVCFLDGDCCLIGWSETCVVLAEEVCGSLCQGGGGCPGTGDCCATHGSPACDDSACCEAVCGIEPDCCNVTWGATCVALAEGQCGSLCAPDPCPGSYGCCVTHFSAACDDAACCDLVCGEDPYCCTVQWDGICADLANSLCAPLCTGVCPSQGECCATHGGPGCDDAACCNQVCAQRPSCCQAEWDATCAAMAESLCTERCGATCPSEQDCCGAQTSGGCSHRECCETVCAQDPFCCFNRWDTSCVSVARDQCGDLCRTLQPCPGNGDCCAAHASPGCEIAACCDRVCAEDASCCNTSWTSGCATLARSVCGSLCGCTSFGDFDLSGSVDLIDVAAFQLCFTGVGGTVLAECACGDLAGDGDVDSVDTRAFVQTLSGP